MLSTTDDEIKNLRAVPARECVAACLMLRYARTFIECEGNGKDRSGG
jgi:hypothetical protein